MSINDHDLVTVYNSNFIHRIHLVKNLLERSGIASYVLDTNIDNIIGTSFVEGYRLQVDVSDVEKAKLLIQKESE